MQNPTKLAVILMLGASVRFVSGQVLYSENFDAGASVGAGWNVNLPGSSANNAATFGFDYSTVGIPSAPHSVGGTTIGLKLEANFSAGTPTSANGLSVSPIGQSFAGDFILTADVWQNFNGNAAGTGSGTTQLTGAGIGTSGTVAQYMNSVQSSIWFAQTGDGGNGTASQDYHAYSSGATSATIGYNAASGVFAAGTDATAVDNANAWYAALGGNTVPAAQTTISGGTQTGTTAAGAPGFRWHTLSIAKTGNTVTYTLDSTLIATINNVNTLTLSGNDIELIQSDVNTGVSTDTTRRTYEFGLFDNVVVTAPEPSSVSLAALALAGLVAARRRK
jgi:MYXO-CTERM domain-containing protein